LYKASFLSFIFHVILVAFILDFFPSNWKRNNNSVDISVDLITDKDFREKFKPKPKKQTKKKEQKKIIKKPKKKVIEDKLYEKEQKKVKKKPVKKQVKKKVKKIVKKSKPKKKINSGGKVVRKSKPRKEVKPVDRELEQMLAEIKRTQSKEREKNYHDKYLYGNKLTPVEQNTIKRQINSCWNNIAKNLFTKEEIAGIKVKVIVSLDRKGNVLSARVAENIKGYMSLDNDLFRQVADSAVSTFYRCKKIYNLPIEKYEVWKDFEFTFDPLDLEY
jgi:colicin import membrane protein